MQRPILAGLLVPILAGCAAPEMSPEQAEALYQARFHQMQAGNLAANYDPLDPIPGAVHPEPLLPAGALTTIAASALEAARDYAGRTNSSAFLVWRNGRLEAASYFGATTAATELNALSLAKPLATLAVGRAMALGRIRSLDQKLADFIPAWRDTPKAEITIRQILLMESGLAPQDFTADAGSVMNRAYLHPYHDRILATDYPLTDRPGSRYAYSNANAELIALLIEAATGRRYAAFLSEEVLAPIGATGGRVWLDRPGGLAHAGCCILLPAETWLRLGILVLDDGVWAGQALIARDVIALMRSPNPLYPYASTMGTYVAGPYVKRRGFSGPTQGGPQVLHGAPYLAADIILFDGNADQVVYIVPSAGLVALRMGGPPPKSPEWDNAVIPNLLLQGIDWRGLPPVPQPAP